MSETDWMWVYENPKEAAAEIDRLKKVLELKSSPVIVHIAGKIQEGDLQRIRDACGTSPCQE